MATDDHTSGSDVLILRPCMFLMSSFSAYNTTKIFPTIRGFAGLRIGCKNVTRKLSNTGVQTVQFYSFACKIVAYWFERIRQYACLAKSCGEGEDSSSLISHEFCGFLVLLLCLKLVAVEYI